MPEKSTIIDMRKNMVGGAGCRSRYLSHAKRALYHLSYAPIDGSVGMHFAFEASHEEWSEKFRQDISGQKLGWRRRVSIPVPLAC